MESTTAPTTTKQIALTLKDRARIFFHDDTLFITSKYNVSDTGVWASGVWLLNYAEIYKSPPESGRKGGTAIPRYSREFLLMIPYESIRFIDLDFDVTKDTPADTSSTG